MMLKRLSALSGLVVLAAALYTPQAMSDEWNKKTVVTVNEPLMIPGATLQPGKYVFKLADSMANRHIVQVFNEDQSQILATILAIPNERLELKGETVLELWETPKGAPRALRAWFYPGDNIGQEFRYPKDEAAKLTAEIHQDVPALTDEDQAALSKHGSSDMASSSTESSAIRQQPANDTTATSETADNSRELARSESAEPAPAQPSGADQQPQVQTRDNQAQSDVQEQHSMTSSSTSSQSDASAGTSDATSRGELPRTASYLPLLGISGLVALGAASIMRISSIR